MRKILILCMMTAVVGFAKGKEPDKRFAFDLYAMAGYFMLPDAVDGYIDGTSYYKPFDRSAYMEASSSDPGYSQIMYKYSHPFDSRTRPNAGFGFHLTYYFTEKLGLGFEFARTFSARDYYADHTVADTTTDQARYSSIPHDYSVEFTLSRDQLYLKQLSTGAALAVRDLTPGPIKLGLRFGLGISDYLQVFRIEHKSVVQKYFQSNGNEVYSQDVGSSFDVFGVDYTSWYVSPGVTAAYEVGQDIFIRSAFWVAVSYIEKGYRWEEGESSSTSVVFYPSKRFFASNPCLSLGLGLYL